MDTPRVAGFCMVRNATLLDFPLEASVRSILPGVDELVLAVGASEDDTLARARAINDPRIRIIETVWDTSAGSAVLAIETDKAMHACKADWGIYIQADEVLADGGAVALRAQINAAHADARVDGIVVNFLHFYGSFGVIGTSRRWYRREIRAVRLDRDTHSYRDAQGFRVGESHRRLQCLSSGIGMFHYSWARPATVLERKRGQDREIHETERGKDANRSFLPWAPGLLEYRGPHPAVVREWVDARRGLEAAVDNPSLTAGHLSIWISLLIERLTGWRPFEFRNYDLVKPHRTA